MTKREALEEARRRWGTNAWVTYAPTRYRPYRVGDWPTNTINGRRILGQGDSFEAAFSNADQMKALCSEDACQPAFADADRRTQGKED